jgi:catechol 2,3-dioxygenase-like lactoylglutathione lyase family enzyme
MTNQPWRASPVLGVANVRQAAEYYRDVLGFNLDVDGVFEASGDEPGGVYAIVKRAGVWIHFQIRRGGIPQRSREAHEGDVYLYVDDVTSLHTELQQQRGAKILQPPRVAPYGLREIIVEDCNGYRLTFGEFV